MAGHKSVAIDCIKLKHWCGSQVRIALKYPPNGDLHKNMQAGD